MTVRWFGTPHDNVWFTKDSRLVIGKLGDGHYVLIDEAETPEPATGWPHRPGHYLTLESAKVAWVLHEAIRA